MRIEGKEEVSGQSLLSKINDGIYIGRIWYTYPIHGLAAVTLPVPSLRFKVQS
ncbi:MAG: hypothetical protein HS132_16730 [Planctomycetia bacterium]|nr:hypothetical protein [Planctomycetia bacterium]